MLKIEILEATYTPRNIKTKGGKDLQLFEQKAYVTLPGEPYPKELKISLWPDRDTGELPKPHPVGDYTLDPKSFSVGRYSDLLLRPILKQIIKKTA